MLSSLKRYLNEQTWLFLLLFLAIHLIFLNADPWLSNDASRGAYTDEGLYVFQSFHLLKGNGEAIVQSDGWLKTPIYNLMLLPFIAFGQFWLLRLIVTLLIGLALWVFCEKWLQKSLFLQLLLCLLCMHEAFFMQTHFALAEGLIFALILLSLFFLFHPKEKVQIWSIFFLALAIGCKIQYIYLGLLYLPYLYLGRKTFFSFKNISIVASPLVILLIFVLIYQQEYSFILTAQSAGKFQEYGNWILRLRHNFSTLLNDLSTQLLMLLWLLSSAIVIIKWKRGSKKDIMLLGFLYFILLLESHKFLMIYLPMRYLFIWQGILIVIVFVQLQWSLSRLKVEYFSILLLMLISGCWLNLRSQRKFQMQEASNSIKAILPPRSSLSGPWAASLSYGSSIKAFTAWNNYFENQNQWQKQGAYIICEIDQNDCDSLFAKKLLPSLRMRPLDSFEIKNWDLVLYRVEER